MPPNVGCEHQVFENGTPDYSCPWGASGLFALPRKLMLSDCQTVLHSSMVESDGRSRTFLRKAVKVLRNPRLAAALINAQVRIRGKARLTLSVRLAGRIRLRGDGDVEFGQGVTLMGDVVPIEFVSHKGARISIGDRTFINYGSSISAHKQVKIGCHCLLGHHTLILDNNEHGVEQREVMPPSAPVIIEDHVWIGSRVIILPGVFVGHHSVVGAGSVVTKDIPANCLAVGNPARVVRRFVRVGVDGVAGAPDCEVVAGCTLSSPDAEYRASAHGAG
jgi:acetyltransferase-like isoleucine patch superfamily enzyme